ncbi:hypothetical protein NQ315_004662 [Exocentrus adspersus]|uniref:tRNA-guanine(15) transglycosylase-like domain-containing protein n=1 Tax=Exocentrus adspersus TaxID=1586481 RepID=A0AAV8VNX2_9CUCU|nr:hypothetical protein NQ315_004662 [Exocentrus adspersus]
MVCVAVKGRPIVGVIHRPFSNSTSWAWVNKAKSRDLHDQASRNGETLKIIVSRSHRGAIEEILHKNFKKKYQLIIAAGAGYKALELAKGHVDAYLHITAIKKWDICAGNAVINSLGGTMTTKDNEEIDYSDGYNVRGPRLGILRGRKEIEIETPIVLLHTQGGHIPHVTHEVFKLVSEKPQILQIPLVSMHNFQETLEYYNGSISQFIGSKDSLTCVTLQDPNGDTNRTSASKRVSKAVENTIIFNKQCLNRHNNSEILKDTFVMAPIAGGYCLKSRQKCIEAILKNENALNGFLIDGLHNNGPEVEFLPYEEIKDIVEYVIKNTPSDKLFSVQGCWNPVNVLKLVQAGIDMFDTSYCRILTERSAAMTFPIEDDEQSDTFEINLRQSKYVDDFTPILASCQCLSCSKYSRGYIHHLLTVQELLAPVLIMIHNIHHYLRFFGKIRDCIRNNTLNNLEHRIMELYKIHQENVLSAKPDEEPRSFRNNFGDVE